MTSVELSIKISDLHLSKSKLVQETKKLENEVRMSEGEVRKTKVKMLNTAMGELAGVNETIKAYAVLHRSCTDQLMLKTIEREYPEIYKRAENLHRRNGKP